MNKKHIWTDEQVKTFWDYESRFPENFWSRTFGNELIKKYSNYLKGRKIILDLGCGDGALIEYLITYAQKNLNNSKIYGIDNSDLSIKKINKKYAKNYNFGKAFLSKDKKELNSLKGGVDFIFCCEVIEHLYEKNLTKLFKTAKNLLNEKGIILFTTPNNEDLSKSLICNPIDGSLFHRWQHVRSWNKESLIKKLEDFNFKTINIIETNTWWWSKFPRNLINRRRYREKGSLLVLAKKEI